MKKLYEAFVTKNVIGYFEEGLVERKDKIKVVRMSPVISEDGELLMHYVLEAEEGVINPIWELN